MTVRELFDFIVDPSIAEEAVDSYLDEVWFPFFPAKLKETSAWPLIKLFWFQVQQKIVNRGDISVVDEIAESVFLQVIRP